MNQRRYLTTPKVAFEILEYYHYENSNSTRNALVKKIEKVCKNLPVKTNNGYTDLWDYTAELKGEKKAQASRLFTDEELNRIKNCNEIFEYFYGKYKDIKDNYTNLSINQISPNDVYGNFYLFFSQNMKARMIFDRDEYARGQVFAESNYAKAFPDFEQTISSAELEHHRCVKMLEALYNLFFEPVDTYSLEKDLSATLIDPDYNPELLIEKINAYNRLTNPDNYCRKKTLLSFSSTQPTNESPSE